MACGAPGARACYCPAANIVNLFGGARHASLEQTRLHALLHGPRTAAKCDITQFCSYLLRKCVDSAALMRQICACLLRLWGIWSRSEQTPLDSCAPCKSLISSLLAAHGAHGAGKFKYLCGKEVIKPANAHIGIRRAEWENICSMCSDAVVGGSVAEHDARQPLAGHGVESFHMVQQPATQHGASWARWRVCWPTTCQVGRAVMAVPPR